MTATQTSQPVWLKLFWMFLKVNVIAPSGPASIGLLYDEAVGKIMTEEDFVEAVGFSSVLPGSDALQLAMFVGHAAGKIPGVIVALMGAILPPTVLMFILAVILEKIQGMDALQHFVAGMSPSVAALMAVIAWELLPAPSLRAIGWRTWLLMALSAVGFFAGVPTPIVLLGAGLLGILLYR